MNNTFQKPDLKKLNIKLICFILKFKKNVGEKTATVC